MIRQGLCWAVAAAGFMFTGSALAAVDGYFAEGAVGWAHAAPSTSDTSVDAASVDRSGMGFLIGMGYQTNQNFAVEGEYVNFGHVKYKSSTASADGKVKTSVLTANIKGILPLADRMSANVKAGLFRSFVDRDSGMVFDSSEKPKGVWGVDYGMGVQYDINPYFNVGLSWFQLLRDQNNSLLAARLGYNFG